MTFLRPAAGRTVDTGPRIAGPPTIPQEQKMRTDVRFPTNGLQLAGHLYLPDGVDGPLAAIVVGHPTTGVKEQAPAAYATRLVKEGFAVLTFDAAFQGESEGLPRGLEDPFQRAEDFRAAVSYLTTRPEIDSDRIGVMGVCGSGAYAPYAPYRPTTG